MLEKPPSTMESDILGRKKSQQWNPTLYVGETIVNDGIRHSMSEKPPSTMESDILCRKKHRQQWNPTSYVGKNYRQQWNPTFYVGKTTVKKHRQQ